MRLFRRSPPRAERCGHPLKHMGTGTYGDIQLLLDTEPVDRGLRIVPNQLRQREAVTAANQLEMALVRALWRSGNPRRGAVRGGGLDRPPDLGFAAAT